MRFISLLARAVTALAVFSAGAAVVAGLTHYLITSQAMDDAHALKAWTIAGGIIAGGAFLPFMTGKARVLLVVGILAAEAFNIGMIAETTWRTRAAAHAERLEAHTQAVADHAARVKARTDAESRLVRAEAAADAKEQARAADASKRDCKRECMAGHLEAVTAARADVTSARTALAATPLPGVAPTLPETGDELGRHWDLAMAVLSSIGGNLIAIGLFAFAGALLSATDTLFRGASDAHPHPRSASRPEGAGHASNSERVLFGAASVAHQQPPSIIVADVSAADAVLLQSENDRALAAFKANLQTSQVLPESDLDVFRQRFLGPLPERHGPLVSERVSASVPPQPEPQPPKPGKRSPAARLPANVVELRPASHPVIAALESVGGSVASNKELAALMGVSSGEATKRRGEVAGLLVEERDGKETRIRLRA